ncbi:integrase core domain-containing protein, partial [Streptomyces sp. 2MCAF27]
HKTLRRELLDHTAPFADLATAQAALDAWAHAYNHSRPHQSLDMATPADVFRPTPEKAEREADVVLSPPAPEPQPTPLSLQVPAGLPTQRAPIHEDEIRAVKFTAVISLAGRLCLPGGQQAKFNPALGGRTVNVWADQRSFHILLDGEMLRTRPSRLTARDLKALIKNGAQIAGPEPAPSALPAGPLPAHSIVEVERTVARDGYVGRLGQQALLPAHLQGRQVVLRFEGQLMHVVASGQVVKTIPASIPPEDRAKIPGARAARSAATPPSAPPLQASRRVARGGRVMVAGQWLSLGARHVGKVVTIQVEDSFFRVLDGDVELSTFPRDPNKPLRQFRANAKTSL